MSAEQRVEETRPKGACPCDSCCPLTTVMKVIGGKWKIPILCALSLDGPLRYNTLLRNVHGITNTMLASSLKELESDGLIKRVQYEEIPVRVEYFLTDKCGPLFAAFDIMKRWGRDFCGQNS